MRVIDVESINERMSDELSFVFKSEEIFHDRISTAAVEILKHKEEKPVVLLTGPSGSGKTTSAMRLRDYLTNLDLKVCMLSMDNFFVPLKDRPPEANDWESPVVVDWKTLSDTVHTLKDGKEAVVPVYDFVSSDRKGYVKMQGDKDALIIVEGIHMLNPVIFDQLKDIATGVYVAPRTRVVTPDDRIIRPEQIRVVRRMIRDYTGRGRSLRETVIRSRDVDRGEMQYIQPYKANASIQIDTFHDYELCILSQYIRENPESETIMDDDFLRENDLTDLAGLVRMLPPLTTSCIPLDSIVREFVGGSRYEY